MIGQRWDIDNKRQQCEDWLLTRLRVIHIYIRETIATLRTPYLVAVHLYVCNSSPRRRKIHHTSWVFGPVTVSALGNCMGQTFGIWYTWSRCTHLPLFINCKSSECIRTFWFFSHLQLTSICEKFVEFDCLLWYLDPTSFATSKKIHCCSLATVSIRRCVKHVARVASSIILPSIIRSIIVRWRRW